MTVAVRMELNQELNGVEIYFDQKPAQSVINTLKENKFRWSGFKSCWYAKQNENTLKLAQTITGAQVEQQETTKEQTEQILKPSTKKENKIPSLFERVKFTPGNTDKSKYHWKYVGSNYTRLSTKETAREIRQHLKTRFPEVKFSITSSHNHIDLTIKQAPYSNTTPDQNLRYVHQVDEWQKANNPELFLILDYCKRLVESYNYDDSDSMTDYFNCHFYKNVSIDYDYIQTEQTEAIKADITDFKIKLEQQAQKEEQQKEEQYKQWQQEQEDNKKLYEERQKEEAQQTEIINNNIKVTELTEEQQYFVIGSQFAKLNKNNTLDEYREEVLKDEYSLENVKITKEIHFQTEEALTYFSNLLLHDFDFLAQTGGSFTDDQRFTSMTDYNNMDTEERQTVLWNLYGVAIYYNNELQFVVDAQGHDYARYVGLVDNVTIQKELNVKQFINPEQLQELKQTAEELTDISTSIITKLDIVTTWDSENWKEYKELIKERLTNNNIKLSKAIIQQIDSEMERLKVAMYRLLKEVDGIQEQFKNADIKQGQKVTLFYISDFGSMITRRITFDNVQNEKYAQYDNAVKLTFKPDNKRKMYYTYFHGELLVYNGWLDLPTEVLYTIEQTGTGFTVTKSKYGSCDKRQYDEIISHFTEQGIKPIINTYKPIF